MRQISTAILATVCYSDIFDYPLTKAQLWRYLIVQRKLKISLFNKILTTLISTKNIGFDGTYYFLPGRQKLAAIRKKRKVYSEKKLIKAQLIGNMLKYFPTIVYVGISGSVALLNAQKDADIDFFVITRPSTLWFTRICLLFFLQIKGVRRKRHTGNNANTICVNMLLDTNHLLFPKNRQDMYTAHEISQLKTLIDKNDTYIKFIQANIWVKKFLPNALVFSKKKVFIKETGFQFLQIFETIARQLQVWYIEKHKTTETIMPGFVAFHPFDYKLHVLETWKKKLSEITKV